MMRWIKKQQYNPILQIAAVKKLYPKFSFIINPRDMGQITFTGNLQPHENMPVYTVKISYRSWKNPRVRVISPELVKKPPHFYQKTKTLCLYHPKKFTWKKEYPIATSIIPWVSSWLYFYEVWKQTDKWYGEEAEHDPIDSKIQNN